MSNLPLGRLLSEGGFGPFERDLFDQYFNFVKASREVAKKLSKNPLYNWRRLGGNEVELVPDDENTEVAEQWKEQTQRILRVTGGKMDVYAVKPSDLEDKGQRTFVKRDRREHCCLELLDSNIDELSLEFDCLPEQGTMLYIDFDSQALDAQHRALERLQKNPHPAYHRPLLGLFDKRGRDDSFWEAFATIENRDREWKVLDPSYPGAEAQIEFVLKALSTPDFVLLKGPPGAGKTTAISEFILQVAATQPGARMLLTASTHVAIDNVLAKLAEHAESATCVRIASQETARNVKDPRVIEMLLPNIVRHEKRRISSSLAGSKSDAAKLFRATIEGSSDDDLRELILSSATLAAGTPRGILQHPFLKAPKGHGAQALLNPVPFDYIILDEASKTSLLEFLVPAIYARRWVIVGDDCQLPPYMGRIEVASALRVLAPNCDELALDRTAGDLVRWRERYFQRAEEGRLEIPPELTDAAGMLRKVFLPSIYGLLSKGHGLARDSVIAEGLPSGALTERSVALDYQNRMHPDISAFPRSAFYSSGKSDEYMGNAHTLLLDNPGLRDRKWALEQEFSHRSIWWDVPADGKEENPLEAFVIASEAMRLAEKAPGISIAVICFYKKQRRLVEKVYDEIADEALRRDKPDVEFLTVDSCQGREADVVFVSFSLPGASLFMRDPNRLNVAITRARDQLILVGNRFGISRRKSTGNERDHIQELAEHHAQRTYINHDLLSRAKKWQWPGRSDAIKSAQRGRDLGHSGENKPLWRKEGKSSPPDRFNTPFDDWNPR